jgi:2-haloacid dehalogenase
MAERWATFDCYGTLIDWSGGIRRALERLFPDADGAHLLERYHELEPQEQAGSFRSYADVTELTLRRLALEEALPLPEAEADALARSLPSWEPFAEVPAALERLRGHGFRLAILSNSDRNLIAASRAHLGVPFDLTIVSEDVGSYKPAHGHWNLFFEETHVAHGCHVHVGASHFHDIAPAAELGLASVWVNRLGETGEPAPTREIPDLSPLPDVAEELVPA